jgi:hypothetical protein
MILEETKGTLIFNEFVYRFELKTALTKNGEELKEFYFEEKDDIELFYSLQLEETIPKKSKRMENYRNLIYDSIMMKR